MAAFVEAGLCYEAAIVKTMADGCGLLSRKPL